MALDDTDLVTRCLQGDTSAFGDLVRRYEHAVYGLALSFARDFAEAEDLAQEAFISAYGNLPSLREPFLMYVLVTRCAWRGLSCTDR